jgi:hypothetical protein
MKSPANDNLVEIINVIHIYTAVACNVEVTPHRYQIKSGWDPASFNS